MKNTSWLTLTVLSSIAIAGLVGCNSADDDLIAPDLVVLTADVHIVDAGFLETVLATSIGFREIFRHTEK